MTDNILVVEDQEDIRALISLNLETLGYQVSGCDNGTEGLERAVNGNFDLIVLDVMLPGLDGLQLCQKLRAQQIYTPILMLTAKKSEADRVVGLEVGADDYLTKPFSVLELRARVKALLRRVTFLKQDQSNEPDSSEIQFSNLTIKSQQRSVFLNGESVSLTAKEFDLLFYMASYPGHVFSREQLLNSVWGHQHSGYEHTVNSHINRLRAKLEKDPANPQFVLTVWGVGYKFNEQ